MNLIKVIHCISNFSSNWTTHFRHRKKGRKGFHSTNRRDLCFTKFQLWRSGLPCSYIYHILEIYINYMMVAKIEFIAFSIQTIF